MIKLLIVDDIPKTVETLTKLVNLEDDIEVCGTASNGQECIEAARRLRPDIILMDVNMQVMDGITATEKLADELPTSPVIIMSVQNERDYMRSAMRAGAAEFLAKPFTASEMRSAIHRVYDREQGRKQKFAQEVGIDGLPSRSSHAKIFTIIGSKGGIGKSVVAANLAVALKLERPSDRVCLLDLSLQFGDVGALFNPDNNNTISNLVETSDSIDPEIVQEMLANTPSGVKLMLAPRSPELAELIRLDHVHNLIEVLKQQFEYVVIDTATGMSEICIAAIEAANRVILITSTANITALKNAKLTLKVLEALSISNEKTLLIVNTLDPNPQITLERVQSILRQEVPLSIPNAPEIVNPSIDQGEPFVAKQPAAPISRSMHELVKMLLPQSEITAEPEPVEKEAKRPRFKFGR